MDVGERQAQLNTQIRFHNYGAALPLAYALRLELQLIANRNPKQEEQMERVELTIKQLERLTEPIHGKLTRWLWNKFVQPDTEPPLPPIYTEADTTTQSTSEEGANE